MKFFSIKTKSILTFCCLSILVSCGNDTVIEEVVEYNPVNYNFSYPAYFESPSLPQDNPLTVDGIALGKMLFYEKMLSKNNIQSCADCHDQKHGFSDKNQFSKGVDGLFGKRQAMPVFNLAWHANGFFWDGRAITLREQSLKPIQDVLEMNETLDNVISKLSGQKLYRDQFLRAFGTSEINSFKISLALEQFMLSIVSHDSKYDKFLKGQTALSESEERGRKLFFKEYNPFFPGNSGADCAHCHIGPNFENNEYMNNGLDSEEGITDTGRFKVTGQPSDKAAFKVPSLRNVEFTAPYMHDGRFTTLEAVIDHYNSNVKMSSSVSPLIIPTIGKGLGLSDQQKEDLVNFLKTLSDPTFLTNTAYSK